MHSMHLQLLQQSRCKLAIAWPSLLLGSSRHLAFYLSTSSLPISIRKHDFGTSHCNSHSTLHPQQLAPNASHGLISWHYRRSQLHCACYAMAPHGNKVTQGRRDGERCLMPPFWLTSCLQALPGSNLKLLQGLVFAIASSSSHSSQPLAGVL